MEIDFSIHHGAATCTNIMRVPKTEFTFMHIAGVGKIKWEKLSENLGSDTWYEPPLVPYSDVTLTPPSNKGH